MNDNTEDEKNQVRFTTMNHVARQELGLTPMEYCIYDSIYVLSTNPSAKGWCTASRQYLADFIGVSRQHAQVIIKTGIDKGLLKVPKEKAFYHDNRIKTTQLWFDTVMIVSAPASITVLDGKKILQPMVRKSDNDGKKILHNKDIIRTDNNKVLSTSPTALFFSSLSPKEQNALKKAEQSSENTIEGVYDYMQKYKEMKCVKDEFAIMYKALTEDWGLNGNPEDWGAYQYLKERKAVN